MCLLFARVTMDLQIRIVTADIIKGNYSFEIKLPENCDNWYLSLNDSDCDYYVELCIHIPSLGDEVLATSNSIHLPTDKVSDKIAEWVPAKPVKKDEINIEENDLELKEIENSNLKEIIELIEDFDLNNLGKVAIVLAPSSRSFCLIRESTILINDIYL